MIASKLFGILLKEFQEANPKVMVPTKFSRRQDKVVSFLLKKAQKTKSPVDQANLIRAYLKLLADGDKKAYAKAKRLVATSLLIAPPVREMLYKKRNQLLFKTASPPGPTRLCRVPFYPHSPTDAWSSRWLNIDTATPQQQAFGIDEIGDDPVLALGPWLTTQNTTKSGPFSMQTRKVEYGAYRMIGLEINVHQGARYQGAMTAPAAAAAATGSVQNVAPAAVQSTTRFTINETGFTGPTSNGINITLQAVDVDGAPIGGITTLTSANPVLAPTQFTTAGGAVAVATALAACITANFPPTSLSAIFVGPRFVDVTMTQFGTVGDGANATSTSAPGDPNGIDCSGFFGTGVGGVNNVSAGSTVSLTDSGGLTVIFTPVTSGAVAPQINIVQATPLTTMTNLANAVTASALTITAVAGLTVNFTQNVTGAAGNTAIVSPVPAELAAVGFAGGVTGLPIGLNLVNPLSPIGITIRELTVYNGDNILIVEDSESVGANDFNILDRPETFQYTYGYGGFPCTPQGQPAVTLQNFKNEHDYKFIGFRDQPIVETNSQVFVKVEGFINAILASLAAYPVGPPLPKIPPIPFSMNLVVDMLDDSIFGDPLVPSPASRSAANIKLGKLDLGNGEIVITNAVARDPNRS